MNRAGPWLTLGRLPVVVALVAMLPYLPSLGGEFLNYDDTYLVTESRVIQEGRVGAISDPLGSRIELGSEYLPVRDLTYALDAQVWGEAGPDGANRLGPNAAFGFRLTNLLWYGLACALGSAFLLQLLPTRRDLALLTALLFALHPAHAESVAWVAGRKDVVSAALVFSTLILHLRARATGLPVLYVATMVAAGLACLAKSTAVALPFFIAAIELLDPPTDQPAPLRRRLKRALPVFAVCGLMTLVAMGVGRRSGVGRPFDVWGLPARLGLVDPPVLRRYLVTSFVPVQLRINHHDLLTNVLNFQKGSTWLHATASLAVLVPLGWLAVRSRSRVVWFASLWFLVGLLPVLNIVPFSQWIADRFLCLPVLGPCLLLAVLLLRLRRRWEKPATVLVLVLLISWAGLTIKRGLEFRTSVSLWESQLRLEPDDPLALRHLGDAWLRAARAEEDPERAVELAAKAEEPLLRSLELFGSSSRISSPAHHLEAHLALARSLEMQGRHGDARAVLGRALELFPNHPGPWHLLALFSYREGRWAVAVSYYLRLHRLLKEGKVEGLSPEEEDHWRKKTRHNLRILAYRVATHERTPPEDLQLAITAFVRVGDIRSGRAALERLRKDDPQAAKETEAAYPVLTAERR